MIVKSLLCPRRVRKIQGTFAFIEHRFLRDGFWQRLSHYELLLYFFLVLVADRNGLSYYAYDKICSILRLSIDEYLEARNRLIDKDLLAFDGHLYQVLALPEVPVQAEPELLRTQEQMARKDPATIDWICTEALGRNR
jgi:hypothetical protein